MPGRTLIRKRRKMKGQIIITIIVEEAVAIREVVGEKQRNPEEGARRRRVALTTVERNLEKSLVNPTVQQEEWSGAEGTTGKEAADAV